MSQGFANLPTGGTMSATTFAGLGNTALNAILSKHSGSSAPANGPGSLPVLYQEWMDSASATLVKAKLYDGANWPRAGTLDVANSIWIPKQGGGLGSVASASSVDLGALPHTLVTITGTTTIAGFGSTPENGEWKDVYAGGAFTLTNSASMICPGGVNLTLAAGDMFRAIYDGGGVWLIKDVQRISGAGVFAGAISGTTLTLSGLLTAPSTTISGLLTLSSTSHMVLPSGTTAQRPSVAAGQLRFNTTLSVLEYHNGTLWKQPGRAPTTQDLTSGTAYTTPPGATRLRGRMVGPGGGSGGTGAGGTGTATSFDSITANPGTGGGARINGNPTPGAGGTGGASGSGTATLRIPGADGNAGGSSTDGISGTANPVNGMGFPGASSPFGGAGPRAAAAKANSGSGAGGVNGTNSSINAGAASGSGAAGEYVEFTINNPAASYNYAIGPGGLAGSGGGMAGGSGRIIIEEFYD